MNEHEQALAGTILDTMEAVGIEDATILDTRRIVAAVVAPFVAARVAEAVERERAAWATKVIDLADRYAGYSTVGTSYPPALVDQLRALLSADDTEAKP